MQHFTLDIQLRWSDLDPNGHIRHSVYYDWAATCRIRFLAGQGLSPAAMKELNFGPILFREECIFRREILPEDGVTIDMQLVSSRRDSSRWTIRHQLMKNGNTLAATVTVDGAWLDTGLRKLAIPPAKVASVFSAMPLAGDFQWVD